MKRFKIILTFLGALIFLGGAIYHLFSLRFASGDVYPPYSSFRSDPLGSRAFFETLELLPARHPERLTGPLRQNAGPDKLLLLLGCDTATAVDTSDADIRELEQFANLGGRVVIAFAPERTIPFKATLRAGATNAPPPALRRGLRRTQPAPGAKGTGTKPPSLQERWGFQIDYSPMKFEEDGRAKPEMAHRSAIAPSTLPETLSWHTSTLFKTNSGAWNILFERQNQPVVLERSWGRGSLVLIADSYHFSNEALRSARETGFIQWTLGTAREILFDETHLGVEEDPGIATLARRYRLEGLAAGLVLLALLYLWRTTSSFIPRQADPADSELVGRESNAGFVHLLRRAVTPSNLLTACMEEWEKTVRRDGIPQARIYQVRDRFSAEIQKPPAEQNPTQTYRDISGLLSPRASIQPTAKPDAPPTTSTPSNRPT